jgi:hypothetical protein
MEPTLHFRQAPRMMAVIGVGLALTLCAWLAPGASASPKAHGHVVHILKPGLRANANKSSNWFGYNQGTLEQGGTQFHSISGSWTVPTVRQHTKRQEEASSDWIGIGGGCVNANCTLGDNTLIQTGTEQDVSSSGKPSYSAWWEVIPGPSMTISKLKVHAGDRMHASVAETIKGSEVWKITLTDVTRHQTFKTTVPYTSSYATAEWIGETPLLIGTNAGVASLPNLSRTPFDRAKVNGRSAHLKFSERILLTNSKGKVIGTPSAPDPDHDGFDLCTWATTCPTS